MFRDVSWFLAIYIHFGAIFQDFSLSFKMFRDVCMIVPDSS